MLRALRPNSDFLLSQHAGDRHNHLHADRTAPICGWTMMHNGGRAMRNFAH
jgi:hypothetical protein